MLLLLSGASVEPLRFTRPQCCYCWL